MGIPGNTAIRPALGQFADAGIFFRFFFSVAVQAPGGERIGGTGFRGIGDGIRWSLGRYG